MNRNLFRLVLSVRLLFVVFAILGSAWYILFVTDVVGKFVGIIIFVLIVLFSLGSSGLIISEFKSKKINKDYRPDIYEMVTHIAKKAGITIDDIYEVEVDIPNAFAFGMIDKNIAFTSKILEVLNKEELEGVIGHEISHLKNRDSMLMTLVCGWGAFIVSALNIYYVVGELEEDRHSIWAKFLLVLFAPIVVLLIEMLVSRSREYLADMNGARLVGNSKGLINALLKLENFVYRKKVSINPAFAPLFIVKPRFTDDLAEITQTHPLTSKRIERLKSYEL